MAGDNFDALRKALKKATHFQGWSMAFSAMSWANTADPATVRALLAERDALQAKVEAMEKDAGRLDKYDRRRLYELMSEISEECYCAGWMVGNEYTLWAMVSDPSASRDYGRGTVTDDQVAELSMLSQAIGGWCVWWDDHYEPGTTYKDWGERILPMGEWLQWYGKDLAARAQFDLARAALAQPTGEKP